jgi:hypothetical protein
MSNDIELEFEEPVLSQYGYRNTNDPNESERIPSITSALGCCTRIPRRGPSVYKPSRYALNL